MKKALTIVISIILLCVLGSFTKKLLENRFNENETTTTQEQIETLPRISNGAYSFYEEYNSAGINTIVIEDDIMVINEKLIDNDNISYDYDSESYVIEYEGKTLNITYENSNQKINIMYNDENIEVLYNSNYTINEENDYGMIKGDYYLLNTSGAPEEQLNQFVLCRIYDDYIYYYQYGNKENTIIIPISDMTINEEGFYYEERLMTVGFNEFDGLKIMMINELFYQYMGNMFEIPNNYDQLFTEDNCLSTITQDGITIEYNESRGTFIINGTLDTEGESVNFVLSSAINVLENKTYYFKGVIEYGGDLTSDDVVAHFGTSFGGSDTGNQMGDFTGKGVLFNNLNSDFDGTLKILIYQGETFIDYEINPQLYLID